MSDHRAEYSKRLTAYAEIVSAKDRLHIQVGNTKLAVVAVGLLMALLALHQHWFSAYWLFLPAVTYLVLAAIHEQVLRVRAKGETAAAFYRKGFARIEDRWPGTGQTGERFRDQNHVYADDLDLFGRGSLFELLSTARLPMGETRLAHWLLTPSPKPAILERQLLLTELREKLDLHRDLAITGEELRARLDPESLIGWAESNPLMPGNAWRAAALALAIAAICAALYYLQTMIYWPFLFVLLTEIFFRRLLRRPAEVVTEGISCNAEGLELFAEILHRFEREPFTSPRLQGFASELTRGPVSASQAIRKLARVVYWIDAHHSLIAHILELPLLYTIQVAFVAEHWRRRWGSRMRAWIDIAAEMEALISLATYSFEHPQDPFPEFVDTQLAPAPINDSPASGAASSGLDGAGFPQPSHSGECSARFSAELLGHPLIPAAKCVQNSVHLDAGTRVLLISGSNMSGKSTLLRVVGINTVLAMAGAPVRAKSLRLTPLVIGTRIRSADSLQEGRSTFYTEILHIRRVFDLTNHDRTNSALEKRIAVSNEPAQSSNPAASRAPLLFLFDELLEGTNSKDRRIGAESLLRALLHRGAIGIVTTHDLALTEITAALGASMRNMHFEDQVVAGKMQFDYQLRDGVVTKSNALELMRLIGLEM